MTERSTKAIAPIPQLISARAPVKATHVPIPPLSGSSSIEALEVALAQGLAVGLAATRTCACLIPWAKAGATRARAIISASPKTSSLRAIFRTYPPLNSS